MGSIYLHPSGLLHWYRQQSWAPFTYIPQGCFINIASNHGLHLPTSLRVASLALPAIMGSIYLHPSGRVGVNSIISTPTPTPEVSTPTPTPANLQNINSNSNSGGFNSNSGKSPEYQLQLQLRRFQLQLQFQLRRFQLQFQLQLRSFKSNPKSISNPITLIQLNYHYPITMWNIVWIKWRYAVDICHVVPNLDQTGQHWLIRW